MVDRLTKEQRSEFMGKIRLKGSDIELALRDIVRPLWKEHRYRVNAKNVLGRPDVWFPKERVAVFADGDFWHGRDYATRKRKLKKFWREKIERNQVRDKRQTRELRKQGIRVLRFWGSDILGKPDAIERKILMVLEER